MLSGNFIPKTPKLGNSQAKPTVYDYSEVLNYIYSKRDIFGAKLGGKRHSKIFIPKKFSLTDSPEDSFKVIYRILLKLRNQHTPRLEIDYTHCSRLDLDAQIFLDIILKDYLEYFRKNRRAGIKSNLSLTGLNKLSTESRKLLYSVGSYAIHVSGEEIKFDDIIPYRLCERRDVQVEEAKDYKAIDTTHLVDYVIDCLERMGRKLTGDAKRDLSQVIGEILINAFEHSSINCRYSVGLFREKNEEGSHFGLFKLVIFNFGKTIYEQFKDPECPTKHIVRRMEELSAEYTTRNFFMIREFEEETLWTLYALQEGVTSKDNYKRRGNGSIRFIDSFFNLKGGAIMDSISRLTLLSGNTRISFDGTYKIGEIIKGDSTFQVMAFNKENDISVKPDKNYVKFADSYFPGTMISANILISEGDVIGA